MRAHLSERFGFPINVTFGFKPLVPDSTHLVRELPNPPGAMMTTAMLDGTFGFAPVADQPDALLS